MFVNHPNKQLLEVPGYEVNDVHVQLCSELYTKGGFSRPDCVTSLVWANGGHPQWLDCDFTIFLAQSSSFPAGPLELG